MRFLLAATLSITLIATSALAQSNDGSIRSYGTAICPQVITCTINYSELPALYSLVDRCININFGYPIGEGFFDQSGGLDTNSCLTAKPNILPKGVGGQLTPHCCLIPSPKAKDACNVRCDLMSAGR